MTINGKDIKKERPKWPEGRIVTEIPLGFIGPALLIALVIFLLGIKGP